MQAATKIGLLHRVGGGNLGDDATLEAVAGNIRRRWPNAEIVAFSMNPDDTETRHGIRSHPLRRKGWSFGYKPSRTQATLRDAVSALARKYKVVFRAFDYKWRRPAHRKWWTLGIPIHDLQVGSAGEICGS